MCGIAGIALHKGDLNPARLEPTLRARMDGAPQLPVDETLRLVSLLAGALDFAHARQIGHRDQITAEVGPVQIESQRTGRIRISHPGEAQHAVAVLPRRRPVAGQDGGQRHADARAVTRVVAHPGVAGGGVDRRSISR